MTISWTDAAIEAALDAYETPVWRGQNFTGPIEDMRAALDAAVKAQQIAEIKRDYPNAAAQYRADALEEAARVAWNYGDEVSVSKYDTALSAIAATRMAVNIAADIRALKEKNG